MGRLFGKKSAGKEWESLISQYKRERGHIPDRGESLLRRALAIARDKAGPDHPDVATTLVLLAEVFIDDVPVGPILLRDGAPVEDSRYCKWILDRALQIREKSFGPNHPGVAECIECLATFIGNCDPLDSFSPTVAKYFERAASIRIRSQGPHHPDLARCYEAAASTALNSGGICDIDVPIMYLSKAIGIRDLAWRSDPNQMNLELLESDQIALAEYLLDKRYRYESTPDMTITVDNEMVKKAEHILSQAVRNRDNACFTDSSRTAYVLSLLAEHYLDQKRWEQAEELFRRALQHSVNAWENPLRGLNALRTIADEYWSRGNTDRGEDLYTFILGLLERVGNYDRDWAKIYSALAYQYYSAKRYDEAEKSYEHAVRIWQGMPEQVESEIANDMSSLGSVLAAQEKYSEAEPWFLAANAYYDKASLNESECKTGYWTKICTGFNYSDQGEYAKAEKCFREALVKCERVFGDNLPEVGDCLYWLSNSIIRQGLYSDAEEYSRRALEITEKTKSTFDLVMYLESLAECYTEQEKYTLAEPLYSRILEIQESDCSSDDLSISRTLTRIGICCIEQSHYEEAQHHYQRALTIRESNLGTDNHEMAESIKRLAESHLCMDQFSQAELLAKRALEFCERTLGPDHLDTADSLMYLGKVLFRNGQYDKAEPLARRALEIRENALGVDHHDVAEFSNNMGVVLTRLAKYEEAEPFHLRAIEIYEKSLGRDHLDLIGPLNDLADNYKARGLHDSSVTLQIRVVDLQEKASGPDSPKLANSLIALADDYEHLGNYTQAEPLYSRALEILMRAPGIELLDIAKSMRQLACCYYSQEKTDLAVPLFKRILDIREDALGPFHLDVAESLNDLALLYLSEVQNYDLAESLSRRALGIQEKALGSDHPDLARSLCIISAYYESKEQPSLAEQMYKKALNIIESSLGPSHIKVADVLDRLASLYRNTHRSNMAIDCETRATKIRA